MKRINKLAIGFVVGFFLGTAVTWIGCQYGCTGSVSVPDFQVFFLFAIPGLLFGFLGVIITQLMDKKS